MPTSPGATNQNYSNENRNESSHVGVAKLWRSDEYQANLPETNL